MSSVPRINASMLSENVGKMVNPTGDKLQLLSCDQQKVDISLREKYEERPGECIQIIGTIKPDLSVVAEKYLNFAGTDFDYELYNSLITNFLPKFPDLFQIQDSVSTNEEMDEWE
ncbi:uncharacterized protein LOC114520893 isoform X2 [Dendronephthya gigantea]|uniref:uncharacterized protein LOC114520893 isoform X2 n=1 Tax=Dendronephthya gigantea TaxID=151771 RepID=UPI00106D71A2|nr:uncharacterized protein LOC114520893 isoform X2 [Dendronephthya gigantea]